nr:uncharacterized mitochondrial protein AtMg00810-like [Tanacetum cinerariifolium]
FFIIAVQTPGSGISILLAVGTPSTGSGNLYCQWELSLGSGNALCILFPKIGELTLFLGLQVKQKQDGIFISQDKYVADILRKFSLPDGKSASTPIDIEKHLLKDPDGDDVDVHTYRSMIGSLMYLTSLRPDIMFAVCASYSDSNYAGASLDRKSTTRGCQFLGCRLISWQCKKQIVVATSSTEADPDQTVSGKDSSNPLMADNLPKFVWYSTHHVALMKSWLVQKQTALGQMTTGKEISNPFMAGSLPKTMLFTFIHEMLYVIAVSSSFCYLVNDVTRLQALVDKKKVIITEATIRDALRLDDAEGINCLLTEEIFTELARMGYEKPSTKLTFYKAFFSQQWKFLIYTILQCMSAKRTSWNEFSSSMDSTKVFANMRREKKGYSRVETPLFEGLIVAPQVDEGAAEGNVDDVPAASVADKVQPTLPPSPIDQPPSPQQQPQPSQDAEMSMDLLHNLLDTCTTLTRRVKNLEQDKISQALEITKFKQRVKKLERRNKPKVSKLRRLKKVGIAQRVDTSDDTVMDDVSKQGRKLLIWMQICLEEASRISSINLQDCLEHAAKVLSMQDDDIELAKLHKVVEVVTTAKLITEVVTTASATITDEAYARELEAELNKNIDWDEVIDQVKRKEKEDNAVMRYQALKRKPQTEAQARKNMMIYLRNMAGFKMDYFKGMKYDDIRPIFDKYFNSNVAFLEKTKEQMKEEDSRAL